MKIRLSKIFFVLATLSIFSITTLAQNSKQIELDKLLQQFDARSPGLSLVIVQDDETVYTKSVGFSNLELQTPITQSTAFLLGSVTKQFTGYGLALLVENGDIDINSKLRHHIDGFDRIKHEVTIEDLVHHKSGIIEQYSLLVYEGFRLQDVITKADVMRILQGNQSLDFKPGSNYTYTNSNYRLLAEIVQNSSGVSFEQFMEKNVFSVLGMKNTKFIDDNSDILMNRASSYELATDRLTYRNSLHNGVTTGSTGLWSTTSDLEKWLLHLVQLRHTRPQLLNRIMKTTTLENGVAVNYGYGWEIDELFEKKLLFHNGVDAGYNSQIYFFPEDDIAIAVVSNNGNYSFNLANQIVEIIFDVKPSVPVVLKEQSEATTEKLSIELKEVDVQRILGDYELGDGNILTIKKVGDYLFRTIAGRADEALTATSLSTVFYDSRPEVELRFENISEDGNFEGFYLVVDGNEIEFCRRIVKPNEDLLKSLVGDFVHSELNIRMKVEYEASKLYLSHYKHGKMLLNASSKPLEFLGTDWWINRVFFRKNKNGNISLHLINPPAGERFEGVRLEMAK